MISKNRKIFGIIIGSVVILGSIGTGLGIYNGYSIKQNAWLLIDGSRLNAGTQKLVIFVDVPDSGGEASRILTYEISSKGVGDNWYFYTDNLENSRQPAIPNPGEIDYIIFVSSFSDENGNWDDFSLMMTLYNNSSSDNWRAPYNFGDKAGNDLKIGIWHISNDETFAFSNEGGNVASLADDGAPGYSQFVNVSDWVNIWDCLRVYYDNANEQAVLNELIHFSFPNQPFLLN